MRKTEFAIEECYHIFNRGVDKRKIFLCEEDCKRFLETMLLLNNTKDRMIERWRDFKKFNPGAKLKDFMDTRKDDFQDKLVEILCFCLNPNHYHFILKQLKEKGVESFMHKLGTSHTNFFNKKNNRSGSLFQGPFKSVYISSNDKLLYLSAYVNMNHYIHGYEKSLSDALGVGAWKYSSLSDYLGEREDNFCNKKVILDQFRDIDEYKNYIKNNAIHFRGRKEMEKYWLE